MTVWAGEGGAGDRAVFPCRDLSIFALHNANKERKTKKIPSRRPKKGGAIVQSGPLTCYNILEAVRRHRTGKQKPLKKEEDTLENKLRALFDFQKFEGSRELQDVIDSVHARYARRSLDEDELDMVNAAGDANAYQKNKETEKKDL